MAQDAAATRKYWTYFAISLVVMLVILYVAPEWFWVALPHTLTYLTKAFDAI